MVVHLCRDRQAGCAGCAGRSAARPVPAMLPRTPPERRSSSCSQR